MGRRPAAVEAQQAAGAEQAFGLGPGGLPGMQQFAGLGSLQGLDAAVADRGTGREHCAQQQRHQMGHGVIGSRSTRASCGKPCQLSGITIQRSRSANGQSSRPNSGFDCPISLPCVQR
mmetsp:Transcript_16761/g.31648  ORF Transcript_16761/g.31648 Transcript_16761/m.31648 type:complete len:118 (-) Transcript_16761:156-509(-)